MSMTGRDLMRMSLLRRHGERGGQRRFVRPAPSLVDGGRSAPVAALTVVDLPRLPPDGGRSADTSSACRGGAAATVDGHTWTVVDLPLADDKSVEKSAKFKAGFREVLHVNSVADSRGVPRRGRLQDL
jgi:hypothetical protein